MNDLRVRGVYKYLPIVSEWLVFVRSYAVLPKAVRFLRRMIARHWVCLGKAFMATALSGCALSWDDADGRRHLLGLGYMVVPQPRPNSNVTVHGLDMAGIGFSATRERTGLTLGYMSERFLTLGEEAAVEMPCLTCPPRDLMLRPAQLPSQ